MKLYVKFFCYFRLKVRGDVCINIQRHLHSAVSSHFCTIFTAMPAPAHRVAKVWRNVCACTPFSPSCLDKRAIWFWHVFITSEKILLLSFPFPMFCSIVYVFANIGTTHLNIAVLSVPNVPPQSMFLFTAIVLFSKFTSNQVRATASPILGPSYQHIKYKFSCGISLRAGNFFLYLLCLMCEIVSVVLWVCLPCP